ncbi:MAG: MFS transporter [Methyloligellaceae bacterium]
MLKSPSKPLTITAFSWSVGVYYGAIFLIVGLNTAYFPVWLDWKGLTAGQIGLVFAIPHFVAILTTPVLSYWVDGLGDRRRALLLLSCGVLASFSMLLGADSFSAVLLIQLFYALFWSTIMPVTEAVAMSGVRRQGLNYGRMRLWGSLSFIAASLAGGYMVDLWGAQSVLWMLLGGAVLLVYSAFHMSSMVPDRGTGDVPLIQNRLKLAEGLPYLLTPAFLCFLATAGLIQSAHALFYAFGTLHWQSTGLSTIEIGRLWSIGVVAEILLFAYSNRVIQLVGSRWLLTIAAVAVVIRWSGLALEPPLIALYGLQILHGLTFGAAHLAAVHYISETIPENFSATAQGVYSAVNAGIFMGSAKLAAGILYGSYAGQAYFAMAAMGGVALLLSLILVGQQNKRAPTT